MKFLSKLFLMAIVCYGCSPRNMNMLQSNTAAINSAKASIPEMKIQKGDLLFVGITSRDPQSDVRYNLNNYYSTGAQTVPSASSVLGYLVDKTGMIKVADIGTIKADNLTTDELSLVIQEKLKPYLKDPIVTVRFLNFRVTVLGEVAKPGTFQVPSEKLTIIEALGLAGDLTIYGKRETVMVIREKNGHREHGYIDLTDGNLFESPYYFLQQNDAVYVSMNKKKVVNSDQTLVRNISIATGVLSTIAIIITALK